MSSFIIMYSTIIDDYLFVNVNINIVLYYIGTNFINIAPSLWFLDKYVTLTLIGTRITPLKYNNSWHILSTI